MYLIITRETLFPEQTAPVLSYHDEPTYDDAMRKARRLRDEAKRANHGCIIEVHSLGADSIRHRTHTAIKPAARKRGCRR